MSYAFSEILLVGCEDDTTITITPTQTVSISTDPQSSSSSLQSVASGSNNQITLNKLQTLLIAKSSTDLTGSKIVTTHVVNHNNPDGKLAVVVHGWNSEARRGYGYIAGLKQNAINQGNN